MRPCPHMEVIRTTPAADIPNIPNNIDKKNHNNHILNLIKFENCIQFTEYRMAITYRYMVNFQTHIRHIFNVSSINEPKLSHPKNF